MNIKNNIYGLQRRVASGLISVDIHPTLDLRIYNYTNKAQFNMVWDEYTKICRGLILDGSHNIVSRPFSKFFNLNETNETSIPNLPAEIPTITEKLDGVLGITYPDNDNISIATRGRFDSPYAQWATKWIREKGFKYEDFKQGYTHCFEVIYPEFKSIVDYGDRSELVLLAVLNNSDTQDELDYIKEAEELGLNYVKEFSFDDIDDAVKWLSSYKGIEREGFVLKYSNGLRIKIKSDDYRRIAKLITGLSDKALWNVLKFGGNVENLLDSVPDEFYASIKLKESEFKEAKNDIIIRSKKIAKEASKIYSRKEQALYIQNCDASLSGVVFYLLDNREDRAEICAWELVKPGERRIK